MTLNSATDLLDSFIQGLVSPFGFQRLDALAYVRPSSQADGVLSFPCRMDPRGPCCFTCHVGVRFDCLEVLLRPGPIDKTRSTIMMPIHLLRENKNFTEWKFQAADDLERLRDAVMLDLRGVALPFIEQYSELTELRRKLESPIPGDWFVLGPAQRLNVLAVIRFVQGDKHGALRILDDELLKQKAALPSKRLPIEAVRKRLTEGLSANPSDNKPREKPREKGVASDP
jgi:hypothetical protein